MNTELIKKLRMQSGAGVLDCKQALAESAQDLDAAIKWLKKKNLLKVKKRLTNSTGEGLVSSYIHPGGRIGVLLEVNVETDFAARAEDFKSFTHQLCLHIAAMNPLYIAKKDVPEGKIKEEEVIHKEKAKQSGKPESVQQKIVAGQIEKWLEEVCLLNQTILQTKTKQEDETVEQAVTRLIAKLGENVSIRRFVRFELGE